MTRCGGPRTKKGAGGALAFGVGQFIKNADALRSAEKLAGNSQSILADSGAFISDAAFGEWYEQYTGPIEATLATQSFLPRDGAPTLWWKYNYKVTGRIVRYYPKSAKGKSIPLKGRIEGYAYGFETWEDALRVTFPKLIAGATEYKRSIPPLEMEAAPSRIASQGEGLQSPCIWGSAAARAMPNSFALGVTGLLEDGELSVVIGEPLADFKAHHRVLALISSPLTGGLGPQLTWYELPFLGAFHIFDKGYGGAPFKLPVKRSGKAMVAEDTFRNEREVTCVHAQYMVRLKACNPGC